MQSVGLLNAILITGRSITVTVLTAVFVHVACSPITVYVVVTVGLTDTFTPVVFEIAVFGLHVKLVAPLAVKLIELPKQMVGVNGAMDGVGLITTDAVPF